MTESQVYLREGRSGELVEASLFDELTAEHLALWEKSWVPAMQDHCQSLHRDKRPEDSHWDWRNKSEAWEGYLGYRTFALVCRGELQGMMMINDLVSARLPEQFGKPLIYVEFVATAPWNRPEVQSPPRYRGAGQVFILTAVEASRDAGFKGRVGLHSLPQAEGFYEQRCGFTRLGRDSSHENLIYFEMTKPQADAFRRQH
jgi:hypothetical protein